tara:strand:- start:905 stop:1324 length:420 start_codon:yes stop_codon:yes gene_type:complete
MSSYSPYPAAIQWGLLMSVPAMTTIFTEPILNLMLMTIVLPMAVSFLSRSGTFFVNTQTVLVASIGTFFLSYLIQSFWPKFKETLKEPQKNKFNTGIAYAGIIVLFMALMVGTTFAGVDMYEGGSRAMNAAANNARPLI